MSARRPTPAYNALKFSSDLGYGLATTPGSIAPGWYQQYLRDLGSGGWQPQIGPAPGILETPFAPQAPAPMPDDEDMPRNALAAYGRRRF